MNCLKCELTRAKILANAMLFSGKNSAYVVNYLCEKFGETYFIVNNAIYRASKISPYTDHKICNI